PYAKEMREIISGEEYDKAGVAIAVDLEQMNAHYHNSFDEIFFVLDGDIKFEFYDPENERIWTEHLTLNETLIVKKGIHHKILMASEHNRLFVVSIPPYHPDDENPSDKI
ncbi:MAG: hypothetical protein AAF462_11880, partial [Thermodesulfobacteriota bacterium]